MLQALRVVLVEHADEVLREALCFSDPDAIFGRRTPPIEYRGGQLLSPPTSATENDAVVPGASVAVPTPTVEGPGVQQ